MWMHDSSIGLASLTKPSFLDHYLDEVNNKDYEFFKQILKLMFIPGIFNYFYYTEADGRIKIETLLKKLKKQKKILIKPDSKAVSTLISL